MASRLSWPVGAGKGETLVSAHPPLLRPFYSELEGATKLKFAPFCSSRDALSDGTLFLLK